MLIVSYFEFLPFIHLFRPRANSPFANCRNRYPKDTVDAFRKARKETARCLYPERQRLDEEHKGWRAMAARQLKDSISEEKEECLCT